MTPTTPRPTPETDAESINGAHHPQFGLSDFTRKLESKRDEAREWQNVKVTKNGETHCLGTLIDLLERELGKTRDQLDAMREAIKKGYDALTGCVEDSGELLAEHGWWKDEPRCDYQIRYDEHKQRIENAEAALTKLKPFIL